MASLDEASEVFQTFLSFPMLPLELRIEIWRCAALADSRIIEVHWACGKGYSLHSYPPALISTCRESRQHTWELYGRDELERRNTDSNPQLVYTAFNYERDILYFPYASPCPVSLGRSLALFLLPFSRAEGRLKEIRHLALSIPPPDVSTDEFNQIKHICDRFARIQEIARNSCDLQLDTLLLVLDKMSYDNKHEVVRNFRELKHGYCFMESVRKICSEVLEAPVSPNPNMGRLGATGTSGTWGNPKIKVLSPVRRYDNGQFKHMVNWSPRLSRARMEGREDPFFFRQFPITYRYKQ